MTGLRALLQFGQQMQGRLAAIQSELAQRTVTGSAGGGMVTVTADGRGQVREVHVDPSLVGAGADVEMLEDLIVVAVAEVHKRAAELAHQEGPERPAIPVALFAVTVSAIEELVAEFAKLPGIGRKTAQRLTYFLLKQPREESARLARSVAALGERARG